MSRRFLAYRIQNIESRFNDSHGRRRKDACRPDFAAESAGVLPTPRAVTLHYVVAKNGRMGSLRADLTVYPMHSVTIRGVEYNTTLHVKGVMECESQDNTAMKRVLENHRFAGEINTSLSGECESS